jgi:hypothetical protein
MAVLRNLQTLLFGPTRSLLHQFGRNLCVGGLAFVGRGDYLISAAGDFQFGLITICFLSRLWVFNRRTMGNAAIEFAVFAAIGVVGLGLDEFIIWSKKEKIHLHYVAAKTVNAGVVLAWNLGAREIMLFS